VGEAQVISRTVCLGKDEEAYVEHVATTLLHASREAVLLLRLRFDAEHILALLEHIHDLHEILCGYVCSPRANANTMEVHRQIGIKIREAQLIIRSQRTRNGTG
jgi:hypothetical protein